MVLPPRLPAGPRGRRHEDAGQATVEYAGALLLVVALTAAILPLATPVGPAIVQKICEALGASCGTSSPQRAAQLAIPCVLSRDDRTLGYNVNVEFLRIDRKDGDQLAVNGDGGASVQITQGGGIGAEAAKELGRARGGLTPDASAKITANGDVTYVYNLPAEYGGEEAARKLLEAHRGDVGQAVDIVLPFAETAKEGLTRLGHGIRNGWNAAWAWTFDEQPSAAEMEARRRADAAGTADAIQVNLSLQTEAKAGASNNLLKGDGALSAEVRGTAQVAVTTSGPDKASSSFSGTALFDLKGNLTLGVPGRPALPPLFNANLGYGQTVSYQVVFDDQGLPTRLVLTTEERSAGKLGLAPGTKAGGTKIGGKATGDTGTVSLRTLTLDLTDARNRAAYDGVFSTSTADLAGHVLGVASPTPDTAEGLARRWSQLEQRLRDDAYAVDYEYELSGDALGASAGRDAYKAGGWGVGGEKTRSSRRLLSAVASDHRIGSAPAPLATCGG